MDGTRKKGRAAVSNHSGRYEPQIHETFDDRWGTLETLPETLPTTLTVDTARRQLPDSSCRCFSQAPGSLRTHTPASSPFVT